MADHDRPLAPRGERAVKLLARYLRDQKIRPGLVLCSSSERTRQTYVGVKPKGRLVVEYGLYGASGDDLLARLRRVDPELASVMLIGHNPGLQMLVLRLAGTDGAGAEASAALERVRHKFPTGALATLSLQCGWEQLGPGSAKLENLVRPADLK